MKKLNKSEQVPQKGKMTLSQKRKLLAGASLPITALVLMMSFQNCSPGVVTSSHLASQGNASANTNLEEDTHPVTLAYSENSLISMQQQTGVAMPSARTLTAANSAKAKIAEVGTVTALNAPAYMAVTNLAGEICLDLVTEEKAKTPDTRRIFNQIDFAAAPAAQTVAAKKDLIRRMSRNFWARNESAAEQTVLLSSIDAAAADARRTGVSDAVDTEDMMVFACTGMLASIDSIKFQ